MLLSELRHEARERADTREEKSCLLAAIHFATLLFFIDAGGCCFAHIRY